jgi:hypothetical protein
MDYTHYPIQKGLKFFKEAGAKAVTKEMEQLDYMDALDPKHPKELSKGEKQLALQFLMFTLNAVDMRLQDALMVSHKEHVMEKIRPINLQCD